MQNGKLSQTLPNNFGVPQGSTLGPLLFLITVNDLAKAVQNALRLFARNTCLLISHNNLSNFQDNFNKKVKKIRDWRIASFLTIYPSKSNALVIFLIISKHISDFNLFVNNLPIPLSINVNYLGVQQGSQLNFLNHLNMVEHKLSRAVGILYKLKEIFPKDALPKPYYALVHPQSLYGLILWGSTFPIYIKSLAKLQNKVVKVVGEGRNMKIHHPYTFNLKF